MNYDLFLQLTIFDSYAASVGATHFSTSAKQNKGIDEAFLHLAKGSYFYAICIVYYICIYQRLYRECALQ